MRVGGNQEASASLSKVGVNGGLWIEGERGAGEGLRSGWRPVAVMIDGP